MLPTDVERRVEDGGSCREKEGGRKLGEEQSIVAKLREGLSGLEPMATLADRNAHDCTRRAFFSFYSSVVSDRDRVRRGEASFGQPVEGHERYCRRHLTGPQSERLALSSTNIRATHPSPALPVRKQFPGDTCRHRSHTWKSLFYFFFLFIFHDARLYVPHRVHCAPRYAHVSVRRPQVTCIAMAVFDTWSPKSSCYELGAGRVGFLISPVRHSAARSRRLTILPFPTPRMKYGERALMKKDDDQELSLRRFCESIAFLFPFYRASGIRYPRMLTTVLSSFRRARPTQKISGGKKKKRKEIHRLGSVRINPEPVCGALIGLLTRPQEPEGLNPRLRMCLSS